MKNLILTMCLLLIVSFTYAQLHVTKEIRNEDGVVTTPNGAVGIGLNEPTEMLEVNGHVNIRGIKPVANQRNYSYLSIGRYNPRRRADRIGAAAIQLYSPEYNGVISDNDVLSHKKPLASFAATIGEVSSFSHNGVGHFQLRTHLTQKQHKKKPLSSSWC